ncbi:MAG: DPP IV N-terminal domain-containing protein, partial [Chloroflexota bacterium]|nr:DPP IV N-terminal domain-containing protein [Chloroflexota bacterium]
MNSPITPDLVYQIKTAGEPSLSPDGSLLAYTLGWVDQEDLSSRSKIMGLHIKGGSLNELTEGTKDSAAKFSPDGTRLTFLRSVDGGPPQIWVMAVDGSDSKQVTDFGKGVFDYVWSPVGDQLAVCADVDPSSVGGDGPDKVPQVTVVSRVRFRYDTLGWRGDAHYHLFVVDIESSESRQITDGDWDDTSPVWSPDGSQIAFMAGRRDDRDLLALNEAYIVLATGGEAELVSQGLSSVGALTWSPDGQRLAVVGSDAPEGMVLWQGWLYVLEQGKEPR